MRVAPKFFLFTLLCGLVAACSDAGSGSGGDPFLPEGTSDEGGGGTPDVGEGADTDTDSASPEEDAVADLDTATPDTGGEGQPDTEVSEDTTAGDAGDTAEEPDTGPPPPCDDNAECADGNPCTDDVCGKLGCANPPISGSCDDGDACTSGDSCAEGVCRGTPINCDDDNDCTLDSCKAGACEYAANTGDSSCGPLISLSSPERAVYLQGSKNIKIEGSVTSPVSPVKTVTLNGDPLVLGPNGSFSTFLVATHGLNVIVVEAETESGATDRHVQAFTWSDDIHPPPPAQSPTSLEAAAALWLAKPVFDDDNFNDVDDMATIAKIVLDNFDLNEAIPNPLTTPEDGLAGFLWCAWTVSLPNVSYTLSDVDVVPVDGGLSIYAAFTDINTAVEAVDETIGCPDLIGTVTATSLEMLGTLSVEVVNGAMQVELVDLQVAIAGVDVQTTSGLAVVANWIFDWFEDNLAVLLEEQLANYLPSYLVPLVNNILGEFTSYSVNFEIPSFLATGDPTSLTFVTEPSDTVFSGSGGAIVLDLGVSAPKKLDTDFPGSFARGTCPVFAAAPPPPPPAAKSCKNACGGSSTDGSCYCDSECVKFGDCCADACSLCGSCSPTKLGFPWSQTAPAEAVVHEDLANQFLFSMWRGGSMKLKITDSELAQFRTTQGLTGVILEIDPAMPPIATTCTSDGALELQLGDVYVSASFDYSGLAVDLKAWLSARARIAVVVEPPVGNGPNQVGVKLVGVEQVDYQLLEVEGLGPGGESVISALLSDELIAFFVENYVTGAVAAFPLPTVNLNAFVPGVPAGTTLQFNPTKLALDSGYLEVIGNVENP
jgi:hypothetical protein